MNHNRKLTDEQAAEARHLYNTKKYETYTSLGKKYGLCRSAMCSLVNAKTYNQRKTPARLAEKILQEQEEIINIHGIRSSVVSLKRLHMVFAEYGIEFKPQF